MVLLPLLGLLAGAGIAAALFQALAGNTPSAPAEAADLQEQTGTSVTIDAADYIGRPVDEVVDELTALGLDVERRQVPNPDIPANTVTDVAPDGVLQPDDTVVVSYAVLPGTGRTSDDEAGVTGTGVDPADATSGAATPTGNAGATDPGTDDGDTGELPGEPVDTGTSVPTSTAPSTTAPSESTSTESTSTATSTTTSEVPPPDDEEPVTTE